MKTSNLIIIGLTGFLLFAYSFVGNDPTLGSDTSTVVKYLEVAVLVCSSIAVVNFLSSLIVNVWFARIQGKQASDLVKLVISLFLYGVCILIIFQLLGKNIRGIFATSALVTAVIGFALQSTLGNFFSGVALQIDQPFQIGDRVIINDHEGWVKSVTWRATTIRTNEGMLVQIPNGTISEELVKVIPTDGSVQRSIELLVSGAAPPQQVIDTVKQAVLHEPHPNINLNKPVRVRMWEYQLAEESLFVTYRILYYPHNYGNGEYQTDREILRRVWYALKRQGLSPDYVPPSPCQHTKLINSIEFFRDLSKDAQKILLKHSKSLLFDAGETLHRHNLPENAMFIVVKGCVNVERTLGLASGEKTYQVFSRRPKAQPPIPINDEVVDQAASDLAKYIGPTAFSLTQEKQHFCLYWLYQQLSAEIHDSCQKKEFLRQSPKAPVEHLQAGDCFGEMCLLLGKPLAQANMVTTVETELLVITQESIVEILQHNRQLLNVLSGQFSQYQQDYLTGTMQMPCQRSQEVEEIEIAMVNLRGKFEAVAGEETKPRSVRRKSLKPVWDNSGWDNSVWDNSVWENFCDS